MLNTLDSRVLRNVSHVSVITDNTRRQREKMLFKDGTVFEMCQIYPSVFNNRHKMFCPPVVKGDKSMCLFTGWPLSGHHKYAKKLNVALPRRENREGDSFMGCFWTEGVSGHMVSIINDT